MVCQLKILQGIAAFRNMTEHDMLRFYHENRVAEPNPPELLLCWVLHYVGDYLQQCLVCSCDSGTVILQVK